MEGYRGCLLVVNLSTGEINKQTITSETVKFIVGGSGLGVKLMLDQFGPGLAALDPLDPPNPLIFLTGPLAGSGLPGTSRMVACAKSPLTGLWGESNVGGNGAVYLKALGYDGLMVVGRAPEPVVLIIGADEVQLLPAGPIWGQDSYAATERLWGGQPASLRPAVFTIGQAGENLVPYAAIIHNKGHVLGRTGMGAVMGSKQLKAVVLDRKMVVSRDTEELSGLRRNLRSKLQNNIITQALTAFGTLSGLDLGMLRGDVPCKNWQLGEWEGAELINGAALTDTILVGRKSCHGCPVACKRHVEIADGPYQMTPGPGPEYETVGAFGTMCLIDDLQVIAKANEMCNRYGMDTISCGASIAFAIECLEKGLPKPGLGDCSGLTWGNGEAVLRLIEDIAFQRGLGRELARGSGALAQQWGPEARKLQTTVKNLEAPMHDPRGSHGLGLAYATSARGACHVSCRTMAVEQGASIYPGIGLDDCYEGQSSAGKANLVVQAQNLGAVLSGAAIVCELAGLAYDDEDVCAMLTTVTGWPWTIQAIMQVGERIWLMKRIFNLVCGQQPGEDALPERLLTPVAEGGAVGSVPALQTMLAEFYSLRGLTPEGVPEGRKLEEAGLAEYSALLRPGRKQWRYE